MNLYRSQLSCTGGNSLNFCHEPTHVRIYIVSSTVDSRRDYRADVNIGTRDMKIPLVDVPPTSTSRLCRLVIYLINRSDSHCAADSPIGSRRSVGLDSFLTNLVLSAHQKKSKLKLPRR